MKCKDCVHDSAKGCCFQVDRNISSQYISKGGSHINCFTKTNNFCTADEFANRRQKAKITLNEKLIS